MPRSARAALPDCQEGGAPGATVAPRSARGRNLLRSPTALRVRSQCLSIRRKSQPSHYDHLNSIIAQVHLHLYYRRHSWQSQFRQVVAAKPFFL